MGTPIEMIPGSRARVAGAVCQVGGRPPAVTVQLLVLPDRENPRDNRHETSPCSSMPHVCVLPARNDGREWSGRIDGHVRRRGGS